MFFEIISYLFSNILYFALHVEGNYNGIFPKPLSQKEEVIQFSLMQEGDVNAKNKLIEHNLRLVAHVVKKYYSQNIEQDDLISIGTVGLIKAVNTFSYEKGAKFATYASRCIENEILMFFRASKKSSSDISFDEPIDVDKDGTPFTLMDIVCEEDNCGNSIIDKIDLKINTQKMYSYINSSLSPREKTILCLRYGLGGNKELTQREIAKKLNISRSYVSRIEKKAIDILKNKFDD